MINIATRQTYDAVVVGSGPNGLAAAITLAQAQRSVLLVEAQPTVGGGTRSAELTLPGFIHDVCSAVHPLAVASPFLKTLPLSEHGLEWIYPSAPVAHPLDDGSAVMLEQSLVETAHNLGIDGFAYQKLMLPFVSKWEEIADQVLGPVRLPRHPLLMGMFGLKAMRSAAALAQKTFKSEGAKALFAGLAAHSILPLESRMTAAFGLILGASAHAVGWPVARGGSQNIANAMSSYFVSLGGEVATGTKVESIDELPDFRAVLFDVGPRQLVRIAGQRLPGAYSKRLQQFRHGPGVFKIDYALDAPIPWKSSECARASTVHLGGTLQEICDSEEAMAKGEHSEKPYVLVAQQSMFDDMRAPQGRHTAWAYCHVPSGSTIDAAPGIQAQIERFAPGFGQHVLARRTISPAEFEDYNPNYIGGDIAGGAHDGWQLLARPMIRKNPYSTPAKNIFLCSASTPPGAGVHGMCGHWAAKTALNSVLS